MGLWIAAVGIALVAAACDGAATSGPDAPIAYAGPVAYQVRDVGDPGGLEVWINGVQGATYQTEIADDHALLDAAFVVELRSGALIVDAYTLRPGRQADDCQPGVVPESIREDVCSLEHGELRYGSATVQLGGGGCVADGFCVAPCYPTAGCGDGRKCTSILASQAPVLSHLGCVDAGARAEGQSCAWIAGDDGLVDDCETGLLCLQGTCRPFCGPAVDCFPGESCDPVPGHAPEVSVCVLP